MIDPTTVKTNRIKTVFIDTVRGLIEVGREDRIANAKLEAVYQLMQTHGVEAVFGHVEAVRELLRTWEREAGQ